MSKTVGARDLRNQISPVLPEEDTERLRQVEIDNDLAELKELAREVADAWTSGKSGVELVADQRR